MGIVYRATQIALGRPVALKLINRELASDVLFRERFKREWLLAAAIDHPNVVPLYEAGEADGLLFLAMRYVEGVDLRGLLTREKLTPERAVAIIGQVGAALDAAHRRGLVHRDVKPANILIADEGGEEHAYLTDFGLTKRASSSSQLTKTGMFVGTLDYVAPEQIRGEASDGRADVYALGCVLYHALTGVLPFARPSDVATMHAHLNDPAPKVTEAIPGAPAGLDAVIARALAKDPAERYQTAGEMARSAREALAGAMPEGPRTPAGGTATEEPHRRRRVALGIALPMLLVAGLAAAALAAAGVIGGKGDDAGDQAQVAPPELQDAEAPPAATPTPEPKPAAQPRIAATIKVGRGPDGLAIDNGRIFVANSDDGTLSTIDSGADKAHPQTVPIGPNPDGVVAGKGVVWTTSTGDDQVHRLDAAGADPVPTTTLAVGDAPEGISLGKQLVWVTNTKDGTVNRIDRAQPDVVGTPIGVGTRPTGIFVGRRTVWVTLKGEDAVQRIDPSTATPVGTPIPVGESPHGVTEADDAVWVANSGDGTVTRIGRRSGKVEATVRVGADPHEVIVGHGFVWVTNTGDNTVSRIDPVSNKVVGSAIPVGRRPLGIDVGKNGVWVANHGDNSVTRIEL
jgi:serine/threonine-protein kinase